MKKIRHPGSGNFQEREWLSRVVRYVVQATVEDVPPREPGGRWPYAVGMVLSFTELSSEEQKDLLDRLND